MTKTEPTRDPRLLSAERLPCNHCGQSCLRGLVIHGICHKCRTQNPEISERIIESLAKERDNLYAIGVKAVNERNTLHEKLAAQDQRHAALVAAARDAAAYLQCNTVNPVLPEDFTGRRLQSALAALAQPPGDEQCKTS